MKTILNALFASILSLIITGPGYANQSTEAPDNLLKTPTKLTISGVEIYFDANVYLDLMPRITSPDHVVNCAKEGSLNVIMRFNVPAFPEGAKLDKVWVHSKGSWWTGVPNLDETRVSDGHLVRHARGCPEPSFQEEALPDVIVRMRYKKNSLYLRGKTGNQPTKVY